MKYQLVSQRFYRFFKYTRMLAIIFLVLFLIVTAFNTDNDMLTVVSYICMIISFTSAIESITLYVLSMILKNK